MSCGQNELVKAIFGDFVSVNTAAGIRQKMGEVTTAAGVHQQKRKSEDGCRFVKTAFSRFGIFSNTQKKNVKTPAGIHKMNSGVFVCISQNLRDGTLTDSEGLQRSSWRDFEVLWFHDGAPP